MFVFLLFTPLIFARSIVIDPVNVEQPPDLVLFQDQINWDRVPLHQDISEQTQSTSISEPSPLVPVTTSSFYAFPSLDGYIDDSLYVALCTISGVNCSSGTELTPFDIAKITDTGTSLTALEIESFDGLQYLINVGSLDIRRNPIESLQALTYLKQLYYVIYYGRSGDDSIVKDSNEFFRLNRLEGAVFRRNPYIWDISVFFRNIGMENPELGDDTGNKGSFIPLCRYEDDTTYEAFLRQVFPLINTSAGRFTYFYNVNNCSINQTPGSSPYNCSDNGTDPVNCPRFIQNEVYDPTSGVETKTCSFIAKEGSNGECFTVHDDSLRSYLIAQCLDSGDIETNGVISVGALRSKLTCNSINLANVVQDSSTSITSVTDIKTLKGLEYAQGVDSNGTNIGLTSLFIDGYDLSGYDDSSEYDKLVIQMLAKHVSNPSSGTYYGTLESGLTVFSATGCGLNRIEEIFDITSIIDGDSRTQTYRLIGLDLSNNHISDVSVLLTSGLFPNADGDNHLTNLDLSNNSICDYANVASELNTYFGLSLPATDETQICPCTIDDPDVNVDFTEHKTCKMIEPGKYEVQCWRGYFEDSAGNCVDAASTLDEIYPWDCQVCEMQSNTKAVYESDNSVVCECSKYFSGENCGVLIDMIPNANLKQAVCVGLNLSSCTDITLTQMASVTSIDGTGVSSFDGMEYSSDALLEFKIDGSDGASIGQIDLRKLPTSIQTLVLENVNLDSDVDFSRFVNLVELSIAGNSSYNLLDGAIFPDSLTSLDISGIASISSFVNIPSSIVTLDASDCASLLSLFGVEDLVNLTTLDLASSGISDPSPLYSLVGILEDLDLSGNYICDSDGLQTTLDGIFGSDVVTVGTQDCKCTSDPPSLSDNKVCSETKPGSNSWFVVCASSTYTTYTTSAADFVCTQPTSLVTNCSGGCLYGQECRNLGEDENGLYEGECQQVIVDVNLHECVASMFNDIDGTDVFVHRTDASPSLFSVASLKTLETLETENGFYPTLECGNYSDIIISSIAGVEHLEKVSSIELPCTNFLETNDLSPLSTLSNLETLIFGYNMTDAQSFDMPDLSLLTSLVTLNITKIPISFPETDPILPRTITNLSLLNCAVSQTGFDINVGDNWLSSLEILYLGGGTSNLITSISSLSADQFSSIITFDFSSYNIYDALNEDISKMSNLETITLSNCGLQTIPDLHLNVDSLHTVTITGNLNLTSVTPLATLINLEDLDIVGNSISDLSPLYDLPNINSINAYYNDICFGSEETNEDIVEKFTQQTLNGLSLMADVYQSCSCSNDDIGYSDTPIADNKVCSETKPGSGVWYFVCSSHSITSYTSVNTFECLTPGNEGGETYGCSGGCEYGYECRYDSDSELSSCQQVIVDDTLHAYVAELFVDSYGSEDYTHRTEETADIPSLFSVASLRILCSAPVQILINGTNLDSSSSKIQVLDGLEHILSLESIFLDNNNISSVPYSIFRTLTNLESVSLYGNTDITDSSFICELNLLESLYLAKTSVESLPTTETCQNLFLEWSSASYSDSLSSDLYSLLTSLIISYSLIFDISPLLVLNAENVYMNDVLEVLQLNGIKRTVLNDEEEYIDDYFDISILNHFTSITRLWVKGLGLTSGDLQYITHLDLTELHLFTNKISDISPLYQLNQTLTTLAIGNNFICDSSSDILSTYLPNTSISHADLQDTSSCGFCSYSETAGDGAGDSADDPVIHCSDTSFGAFLSSNTICRKVWDWTETVEEDDGSGGVTTTTIYHEQWSVECNLYSYKVDNVDGSSSCVSYLDDTDDNYTPPDTFPSCVSSSMDNVNMECCSPDGTETSCIEGWYGDECMDACDSLIVDDIGYMCNVYDHGTCDSSTRACSCSGGFEGAYCQYIPYEELVDFICSNREDSSIVEVASGASIECDGDELTPTELLNIIGLDLSSSNLSDISGLRYITNLVSLNLSEMILDETNSDSYDLIELSDLTNLELLDVSGSNINLPTAIPNIPNSLISLNVSGCSSLDDLSILEPFSSSLISLNVSNLGLCDFDLFDISLFSSLTTLDVSDNSLTDISLLYSLEDLISLDVRGNKLCGVTDEIFKPFFTLSDSITIMTGNPTFTAIDQGNNAYCGYCSDSTPSVDPSSNVVCKDVWSGEYHTDCAIFSYRDYSNSGSNSGSGSGSSSGSSSGSGSEEPLTCVNFGSEVDTSSLTCLSGIESNPNTQCIGVYNESDASVSIESGCVEGWYGDECLDECPLHYSNQLQCGGSEYGTCDSSTHTCDCSV
ncbi:hypothetical protein ADUPG1_012596, partial [Aduncisulcus paluster]